MMECPLMMVKTSCVDCAKCVKKCVSECKCNFGTFKDGRDGKEYRTVKIGEQTWLGENLAFASEGSMVYLPDDAERVFGRLYDWDAAMKAAPEGWRLPTREDWDVLRSCFPQGADARGLKSAEHWEDKNGSGQRSDVFGFSALPGGWHGASEDSGEEVFRNIRSSGRWWSAGNDGYGNAYCLGMEDQSDCSMFVLAGKSSLMSVRLVKNA